MTISEHAQQFAGKSIVDYDPQRGIEDPTGVSYRLALTWDDYQGKESLTDRLAVFLHDPRAGEVQSIVFGCWNFEGSGNSAPLVEVLVAARASLPNLRAIFLGDITCEEQEISWILQSDVSPLFTAYPRLEHLRLRGNEGLSLGTIRHDHLRSLVIEAGGLSGNVVREVAAAHLPRLEHLELWLGTPDYGGDATIADLEPILAGRFPNLRYLGLRNSAMADAVAAAVAAAPVLKQIQVLDLSLGNLSDEGARALLASPYLQRTSGSRRLQMLDLHFHYVSDEVIAELKALGLAVYAADRQTPDEWDGELHRYNAVSE